MKVYLIYRLQGEYDSFRKEVIGVYLDKEKCELKELELTSEEEKLFIKDVVENDWNHDDIEYCIEEVKSDELFK